MPFLVNVPADQSLQVPEAISAEPLKDPNGVDVGYDQVMHVYFGGEIIPDAKVSPSLQKVLEDADETNATYLHLKDKLKKVGDDAKLDLKRRLGVPFEGYEETDVKDIVAALHFLPSTTIQAVKEYEASEGEGRKEILLFNAGTRDNNYERVAGEAVSDRLDADDSKEAGNAVTRTVGESSVIEGEGYTGSDPDLGHELAVKEVEGTENPRPKRAARRGTPAASAPDEG